MKVSMASLVEAIKRVVEAGDEEKLKQLSKQNGLFVTANKDVVSKVKKTALKATASKMKGASKNEILASFQEVEDDCRT